MNKLKLFFAALFAVCVSAMSVFAADDYDVKNMKIAVIWNPYTYNTDAPRDWIVGNEDYQNSGKWEGSGKDTYWAYESKEAPEISKAQLKFFLWSLNKDENRLKPSKTLDTTNTPEWADDLSDLGLPNVAVYRSDDDISYDRIKSGFGGVHPNAIVYIGAGAELNDEKKSKMFKEAAKEGVGIFFIGQRSVTDARDLDPEKTTFPVMGVQKEFRIKQYGDMNTGTYKKGDVIKEFDFLTRNNDKEWDRADTVTIHGNDEDGYKMYLIEGDRLGEVIYENKKVNNKWQGGWKVKDTVFTWGSNNILHQYGEWSIRAKAVEVVETDTYESEMNYGFHKEKDLWVCDVDGKVYLRKGSPSLFLNGIEKFKETNELTGAGGLKFSNGEVEEDWILEADNPETKEKDRILVMHKGQKIAKAGNVDPEKDKYKPNGAPSWWDAYSNGNYVGFNAGGLRDLRIVLNKNAGKIYDEIFGRQYGGTFADMNKTELRFKPYGSSAGENGRIQAGASIWAFNEKLNPKSFSSITSTNGFSSKAYYADYLGDQMAGKPNNTKAQFVRPQVTESQFDNSGNSFRESELPATNTGNTAYYKDFSGKLFHQISVVQHGRQRLAMVGYQPTYLEDADASRAILHDITLWIGYDHYGFPSPEIQIEENGSLVSANGKSIGTDQNYIVVVFDRNAMSDDMKNYDHELLAKWEYGGKSKTITVPIKKDGDGRWVEIKIYLDEGDGDDHIGVNSSNPKGNTITITAWTKSNDLFDDKDPIKAEIKLKQLTLKPEINGKGELKDADTLRPGDDINVGTLWDGKNEEGSEIILIVTGKTKEGKDTTITITIKGGEKISSDSLPDGEITIKIIGKKDGFVDSEEKVLKVTNVNDRIPPYIVGAMYFFPKSNGNTASYPVLEVWLNEESKYGNVDKTKQTEVFRLREAPAKGGKFHDITAKLIDGPRDEGNPGKNFGDAGFGKQWWKFQVISISDKYEPIPNSRADSVNVHKSAGLRDVSGNGIVDSNWTNLQINKLAWLQVNDKPVNLDVNVITNDPKWKEKNPPVETIIKPVPGGGDPDINVGGSPIIVVIDPGFDIQVEDAGKVTITAVILDAVGNKVVDNSSKEHFKASLVEVGTTKRVQYGVFWDAKNAGGRDVGAGTYLLLIDTKWPRSNETYKYQQQIRVPSRR